MNQKVHYGSHNFLPPLIIQRPLDPVHVPTSTSWRTILLVTCPKQAPNIPRTKSHTPFSLHQNNSPCLKLIIWLFGNSFHFYSGEMSAPRPYPKLEDYAFSDVRDCLFDIFAATLHIGGCSYIRNLRTLHAVVTWTHLSGSICTWKIFKWHELTLVGLEEAVLQNDLTIVVNCYDVGWPIHQCCKSDIIECNCVQEFVII